MTQKNLEVDADDGILASSFGMNEGAVSKFHETLADTLRDLRWRFEINFP